MASITLLRNPGYPCPLFQPLLSYIKKGLKRFVNGDYAWAMQEGMMLAYVHPNYKLSKLEIELKSYKTGFLNTINHLFVNEEDLYKSKHSRHFEWIENRGSATPINIYHLWKTRPV